MSYHLNSTSFITEFAFHIVSAWWQSWWFYTLAGIMLITGFWITLILRVKYIRETEIRKLNQEREISELRIKALQAQMNPHFTFNAINSIQYYLINNDKNNAFQFIGYFSKLIRQTLESAFRSSVSIKEEVAFIENYISLELMRFEDKFSYDIKIDPILDSHQYQIPPMLLQPFVENAILHGLLHKDKPGMLKVRFEASGENALKCTVEDDGIGRDKSAEINRGRHKNHKSVGLEITRRRVGLLNQPGQKDYNIKITDLYDENNNPGGTKVEVIIPLFSGSLQYDGGEWD